MKENKQKQQHLEIMNVAQMEQVLWPRAVISISQGNWRLGKPQVSSNKSTSLFHVMHNTYAGLIQYNYPHVYTHIPNSASTPTSVGTCVCVLYQCCKHVHTLVLHVVA